MRTSTRLSVLFSVLASSAAWAQPVLVPTSDNRTGATLADSNEGSFPEPVENGYTVGAVDAYLPFSGNFPAVDIQGGNVARANISTNSQFVGLTPNQARISGLRFNTSGSASITRTTSGRSLARSQEVLGMTFRLENLPAGQTLRYRLVGSSAPLTGGAGGRITFRRGATLLLNAGPGSGFNQVIALTQNADYELRGEYTIQLTRTTVGTTNASAAIAASFVCVADFDGSGTLTPSDIFAYLNAYFAGQVGACDVNGSNSLTPADIFTFLTVYFSGCTA